MLPTSAPSLPGLGWAAERQALNLLGYSAPLPLAEPDRARTVHAHNTGLPAYSRNPHVSSDKVRRMLRDPAPTTAVAALCGDGFRLWRSAFFAKSEGSREIGWHHDKHFNDGDEDIGLDELGGHYSILFGLTDITQTTGQLEMLPGSHRPVAGLERDTRPYHLRPREAHILTDLSDDVLAMRRPVPIPAGCFVVFHSAILHRSLPHTSGGDRLGLAIRLAKPDRAIPAKLAKPQDIMPFPPPA
ncbi:phytanoyl-CoA dioxygenase family protein [Aestuariicoccus sp. MJ-SS9]|uniref:phytanoyl-CoA dioxygenase family protein n=1 Tax=Aestuariicoccus sp. MJ-SS9 TaxID=3079855 RepID=UPI0029155CEB|nr:phytanoyl-CoA dioxygenase family protein [Aestuariicoccus sp. MJ-SS9]MDU8912167.1 phytanoyl-CoA dioxygenase family protein [Aestuariicoccus sp. MJ-SS9]